MPTTDLTRTLTVPQRHGAVLEAAGASRRVIAEVAGVSESTVTTWRGNDSYREEVERLRELAGEELAAPINELRRAFLDAAMRAVEAMVEQLEARTRTNHPDWNARAAAAKLLFERVTTVVEDDDASAATTAQAAVTVVFNEDSTQPPPIDG